MYHLEVLFEFLVLALNQPLVLILVETWQALHSSLFQLVLIVLQVFLLMTHRHQNQNHRHLFQVILMHFQVLQVQLLLTDQPFVLLLILLAHQLEFLQFLFESFAVLCRCPALHLLNFLSLLFPNHFHLEHTHLHQLVFSQHQSDLDSYLTHQGSLLLYHR